MLDQVTQSRRTFAPRPEMVVFQIGDEEIETPLWNFMDLPAKSSLRVYELEGELVGKNFAAVLDLMREIVGLLCPKLAPEHLAELVPNQMQDAIAASHGGVVARPQMAERQEPAALSPGTSSSGDSATADSTRPA